MRSLVVGLILTSLASVASAKPRSTQPDRVLAECRWAAEVNVLSAKPAKTKGALPTIHVRVTKKRSGIFFGQKPGASVVVWPEASSAVSALADLAQQVGSKEPLLMVVTGKNTIAFVGKRIASKPARQRYLLRTWYDYNAWWMFSQDKNFGTKVKLDNGPLQTLEVSAHEIRSVIRKARLYEPTRKAQTK